MNIYIYIIYIFTYKIILIKNKKINTNCVDLCLCVCTRTTDHVPHLSSKTIVQLCSFAADIALHNRQRDLKQKGLPLTRHCAADCRRVFSHSRPLSHSQLQLHNHGSANTHWPHTDGGRSGHRSAHLGRRCPGWVCRDRRVVSDWKKPQHCMYSVGGLEWSQDTDNGPW